MHHIALATYTACQLKHCRLAAAISYHYSRQSECNLDVYFDGDLGLNSHNYGRYTA
jgi:hypothetical protein